MGLSLFKLKTCMKTELIMLILLEISYVTLYFLCVEVGWNFDYVYVSCLWNLVQQYLMDFNL
jgi:hypothetical protein